MDPGKESVGVGAGVLERPCCVDGHGAGDEEGCG